MPTPRRHPRGLHQAERHAGCVAAEMECAEVQRARRAEREAESKRQETDRHRDIAIKTLIIRASPECITPRDEKKPALRAPAQA